MEDLSREIEKQICRVHYIMSQINPEDSTSTSYYLKLTMILLKSKQIIDVQQVPDYIIGNFVFRRAETYDETKWRRKRKRSSKVKFLTKFEKEIEKCSREIKLDLFMCFISDIFETESHLNIEELNTLNGQFEARIFGK